MRQRHCWKDKQDWIEETYGIGSEEWCEYMQYRWPGQFGLSADPNDSNPSLICMLADGHEGEHDFTNSDEWVFGLAPTLTELQRAQRGELN